MYELIHANRVDVLRAMPDKSVHGVVTDMPYGVGIDFGDYRDGTKNLKRLIEQALPEMRRVARLIAVTPGVRNMYLYPKPTWTLGWFFGGGARGRWGFNHWQPVLVYGPDPRNWLKMMHTDVIRSHSQQLADRTDHPCPKPLSFVHKLINTTWFSDWALTR